LNNYLNPFEIAQSTKKFSECVGGGNRNMDHKMNIWFEPLHGLEQPIGTTFICYSRKDSKKVEKILQNFSSRGLPYFID